MRLYKRTLIPATAFFALGCLLSATLPISGARWQEVIAISGNVESIKLPPASQAGTTLSATKTATGYAEEQVGITIFGVRGEICVENGGKRPTEGLAIIATVQAKIGSGQFQDYVSEPVDVSEKAVLEPGQEHCYPYEFIFTPIEGEKVKYRNAVSVTILNHSGWLPGGSHCDGPEPCPFGPNPKAEFTLPEFLNEPMLDFIGPVSPEVPATPETQLEQTQATDTLETESTPSETPEYEATEPPSTQPVGTEPPPSEPASNESPPPAPTELPSISLDEIQPLPSP